MNPSKRRLTVCVFASFVVLALAMFAYRASAQGQQWQVMRADYGFRDQRADVTQLVRALVAHGGVNGHISVNNQTMGGDPWKGADKNLRIVGKDQQGNVRDFTYKEGASVNSSMFRSTQ